MSNARNLADLLGTGTQITTADIADEVFRSNKNIIKNGAMVIAQRATSVTGDTAGGSVKTVDRMNPEMNAAGTWTQSQSTDVPSGQGFVYSFKLDCTTADASLAANDYVAFGHRVEGLDLQRLNYGTSGAKNSVLSFWVKTNKAGNYVVGIQNGITGGTSKNCSFLYTVSSANTWQKVEFSVPGDTAAAFDNDANASAYIYWWLAVGSNYNTGTLRTTWTNNVSADFAAGLNVNLADSTDNEWYITGIQWEEGDVGTPFDYEDYGTTLAKCQRYFCKTSTTGLISPYGAPYNFVNWQYPVEMRATPTLGGGVQGTADNLNNVNATYYNTGNNYAKFGDGSNAATASAEI
tara:strand:+ start:143 stop:1189 length:1047 start_codon:yes stop_codon:yes gene_type:complete